MAGTGNKKLESIDYWRKRVFKNSYTRHGERIILRNWSIKLQREGVRRTLSLRSPNRENAALEARELFRTIARQGWEAFGNAADLPHLEERDRLSKTDAAYWELRLLRRGTSSSTAFPRSEMYSIRIEHQGRTQYFPLQTTNSAEAASKSRDIYLKIAREGWESACQTFLRELTVAIHWSENPLAWTYSTVQITPGSPRSSSQIRSKSDGISVLIFDSDPGVRFSLARCIDSIPGFFCSGGGGTLNEAAKLVRRCPPGFLLVNRGLCASTDPAWMKRNRQTIGFPIHFFGVYEDSDDVFRATPGGAAGYFLKRTSPERLLDPILDAVHEKKISSEKIRYSIQNYFQNVIHLISRNDAPQGMEKLTRREHEILNLVSKGCVDKEIAGFLGISGWTVHGHLKKIFEKLEVHTRTEAAIKYLQK